MSPHCVRNEIKKKFNVTYIFDPNMPWSKLGFFYIFLYQSYQSICFLTFWRCLEPALFIEIASDHTDLIVTYHIGWLLKWKHFSFSKGIFSKVNICFSTILQDELSLQKSFENFHDWEFERYFSPLTHFTWQDCGETS